MCSFLSSAYYTLLSITVPWQSSSTLQQYFHSASVVFSSEFCREEFYTSEKPVGRGSGQTERAVKPDTK